MNDFIYNIPTKVYFGKDQLKYLGQELKKYGNKVLLTYGGGSIKKSGLYDEVVKNIKDAGLELFELSGIEPNPRITSVTAGAKICKEEKIDVLLAVGGGSVIDCTKFIGAAAFYDGDAWDILTQKTAVEKCLPIVDILTLSATGSEMDCGGVISNLETKDKIGMAFPVMRPKVSFLNPELTYSVSAYQTACGAADILSHIFEEYFNLENDLYMLDTVMEGLMKTVIKYAPVALQKPNDYEARANLMWASSWAINDFINGGKQHSWSVHPIEHELSAIYDITHGLGLAILTPRWMKYVLNEKTVDKFYQFGCNVFNLDASKTKMEVAKEAIACVEKFLYQDLGLQSSLSMIDIDDTNFTTMAKKAVKIGGLANAFIPLDEIDVENIYKACL